MRVLVLLVVLAAAAGGVEGQFAVGPNGVRTPPINLLSVFRFLRDFVMAIWFPETTNVVETTVASKSGVEDKTTTTREEEEEGNVIALGYDTEGNIVEKVDYRCDEEGESCQGAALSPVDSSSLLTVDTEATSAAVKLGTTQVVTNTWSLAYITFATICFWLFVLIATPYIITGETITRSDDSDNSIADQQDVLLLLAWLLGEASNDKSCLERVVCLTPTKSSRYISVSTMVFNVASFLRRWVPYSSRYVDLLRRMDEVTEDGFAHSCSKYHCPTVPEL